MEFVLFILASIGMAHILVDGTIFQSFKAWLAAENSEKPPASWFMRLAKWARSKLLALMTCYQCSGFWSGVVTGYLFWLVGKDPLLVTAAWLMVSLFLYGCAASFLSTVAAVFIMWMQNKLD